MPSIDQFESQFKAAVKGPFHFSEIKIEKILVITDLSEDESLELTGIVKDYLSTLHGINFETLNKNDFYTVSELLNKIEELTPDLIITYRHIHSDTWKLPYSLGEHLDVLTQVLTTPVLVIPHPSDNENLAHLLKDTNRVMAITNHLTGDDRLVNYSTIFSEKEGKLILVHVEDDTTFERYIDIISKIPEIDTDLATKKIKERILKEPSDYIDSCKEYLKKNRPKVLVEKIVVMDHQLSHYKKIIRENSVDLLVMNTKDDKQQAMNGMAFSFAIEIRKTPLLLI